jgi:hypothetical protein
MSRCAWKPLRAAALVPVLAVAACGLISDREAFSTPVDDSVHVVVWRLSETEMTGYVPVCPADEVRVGVSVDQTVGVDGGVGVAANEGVIERASVSLLEFRLAPDIASTGSLTEELPIATTAGPFDRDVTALSELGGFFVETSRTYATADLDQGLPSVGSGWLFVGGGTPTLVGQLDEELASALASVACDNAP